MKQWTMDRQEALKRKIPLKIIDWLVERGALLVVVAGADRDPVPALAAAQFGFGQIAGDGVEPGRDLFDGRKLVAVPQAAEEGLLDDILRGFAIADKAVDEVVERRAVALDEQGEMALIFDGPHQDFLVRKFVGRFHYYTLSRGERRWPRTCRRDSVGF